MKTTTLLRSALFGLLLMTASGFSAIPDSIWKNDTLYHDLWNKTSLDTNTFWPHNANWGVANAGTDSAMITTDGLAHAGDPGWTNLTWKFQASPEQANVELRFSWRMTSTPSGNSGFNMRGFCGSGTIANLCGGPSQGYRVFGPQMDLGPTYTGNVYNSGNTTLATAPAACHLNTTNFMDLSYKISNDTIYMSYYPNGFAGTRTPCTTYKLTNASHVAATSPGLIALQYETVEVSQFKNIKIRNLDGVGGGPSGIRGLNQKLLKRELRGDRGALVFGVAEKGAVSVQVMDVRGTLVKSFSGEGPLSQQRLTVGRSGLFIVKIASFEGISLSRVYIH